MIQRWVNLEKRRYYQAFVVQNLLEQWEVVLAWGAMDSKRGGGKVRIVESREAAEAALKEVGRRRRRRGYDLMQCSAGDEGYPSR